MTQSRFQIQRWHVVLVLVGVAVVSWLWQHCQHCSSITGPPSETSSHIVGVLAAALIAAAATWLSSWWAARSTMKNARELQERDLKHARELQESNLKHARKLQEEERRRDEQSVAALLSADLHRRLTELVILLEGTVEARIHGLASMSTNIKVLEAALPKLGDFGQQGAANLLNAFNGVELLAKDARARRLEGLFEHSQEVALYIGRVIHTLGKRYDLDLPPPSRPCGARSGRCGAPGA